MFCCGTDTEGEHILAATANFTQPENLQRRTMCGYLPEVTHWQSNKQWCVTPKGPWVPLSTWQGPFFFFLDKIANCISVYTCFLWVLKLLHAAPTTRKFASFGNFKFPTSVLTAVDLSDRLSARLVHCAYLTIGDNGRRFLLVLFFLAKIT